MNKIHWIPIANRLPGSSDADENNRVLCLHEDGGISSTTYDCVKYRTMMQYLGFPVVKWAVMPSSEINMNIELEITEQRAIYQFVNDNMPKFVKVAFDYMSCDEIERLLEKLADFSDSVFVEGKKNA